MKKTQNFIKTVLCIIVFSSCESFIADDINLDPNNPGSVTLNAVLPSIEVRMMDWYGIVPAEAYHGKPINQPYYNHEKMFNEYLYTL